MTGVAVDAVVDVAVDAAMTLVCRSLGMAVGTGKDSVVGGVGVASGADAVGAPMAHVEPCVIECRAEPGRGVVASGARSGESRRDVVGVGGGGVLRFVAGVAIGGRSHVDAVDVALSARNRNVCSSERKRGFGMIEDRVGPRGSVVAYGTGGGKSGIDVIGIGGGRVLRFVAGVAIGWNRCVVVVDVAKGAGSADVRSGKRESRLGVIERGRNPAAGGMADGAIRGKS